MLLPPDARLLCNSSFALECVAGNERWRTESTECLLTGNLSGALGCRQRVGVEALCSGFWPGKETGDLWRLHAAVVLVLLRRDAGDGLGDACFGIPGRRLVSVVASCA